MSFVRLAPEQFDSIPGIAEPAENPLLVGHKDAAEHFALAYHSGKLHHALLLCGPAGIGKATLAFHMARHVIANPNPRTAPVHLQQSDESSPLFRQIAQGVHPAVLHLTRPQNEKTKTFRSAVTVDEIRKISRFLGMTSHDGGFRVVIIDPADDMNTNAANALLKNLEEPPARTLFILISHAPGGLLPTIRSRCHAVKLKTLGDDDLLHVLKGLSAPVPEDVDSLLSRAGGSAREALLLTQYGGLEITQAMIELLRGNQFSVSSAWRIAEAVSGRDSAVQFSLFNQLLLDFISDQARMSAAEGNLEAALRLSEFWQEAARIVRETEIYNLDKKQHASGLLRRTYEAFNG